MQKRLAEMVVGDRLFFHEPGRAETIATVTEVAAMPDGQVRLTVATARGTWDYQAAADDRLTLAPDAGGPSESTDRRSANGG